MSTRMTVQRLVALIEAGDVDAVDAAVTADPRLLSRTVERDGQDGWTPLHLAVHAGSVPLTRRLAAAGADLAARTEHGRTPVHTALQHAPDLVPVLRELGAPVDAATAAWTGEVDRLTAALDDGAPLSDPRTGVDLLTWAAGGGSLDAVRLLLGRGADVDGGALQAAAHAGHVDVVELLLAAGARVDRRDPDTGQTALHGAVTAEPVTDRTAGVVRVLLAAGASPEAITADGATALDILQVRAARGRSEAAGSTGADELVELLVAARTA